MIKEPPSGGSFALPSVDLRQPPDVRRQPGRGRAGGHPPAPVARRHAGGVNIISVAVDAPADAISALSGKIGRLAGITAKTVYAPEDALQQGK